MMDPQAIRRLASCPFQTNDVRPSDASPECLQMDCHGGTVHGARQRTLARSRQGEGAVDPSCKYPVRPPRMEQFWKLRKHARPTAQLRSCSRSCPPSSPNAVGKTGPSRCPGAFTGPQRAKCPDVALGASSRPCQTAPRGTGEASRLPGSQQKPILLPRLLPFVPRQFEIFLSLQNHRPFRSWLTQ